MTGAEARKSSRGGNEAEAKSPSPAGRLTSAASKAKAAAIVAKADAKEQPKAVSRQSISANRRTQRAESVPALATAVQSSPATSRFVEAAAAQQEVPDRDTLDAPDESAQARGLDSDVSFWKAEAERTKEELDRVSKRLEDLQVQAEQSEQDWSHEQMRQKALMESERARREAEFRELMKMSVEDTRNSILNDVLEHTASARQSMERGCEEALEFCRLMQTERVELEAKVKEMAAELDEEQQRSARLLRQLRDGGVKDQAKSVIKNVLGRIANAAEVKRESKTQAQTVLKHLMRRISSASHVEDFRESAETESITNSDAGTPRGASSVGPQASLAEQRLQAEWKKCEMLQEELRAQSLQQHAEIVSSRRMSASAEAEAEIERIQSQTLHEELLTARQKLEAQSSCLPSQQTTQAAIDAERALRRQLQEELQETHQRHETEAGTYRVRRKSDATALESERLERKQLMEELQTAQLRLDVEATRARAMTDSTAKEAQSRMRAEAEMAEAQRQVSQLRAELTLARGREEAKAASGATAGAWKEEHATHALLRAMLVPEVVGPSNGHPLEHATSWAHGHAAVIQGPEGRERMLALAQNSANAVAALLKQVKKLGDTHHLLSDPGSEGKAMAVRPAQLRAVRALERQTGMLERTNQEWAFSLLGESMGHDEPGGALTNGWGGERHGSPGSPRGEWLPDDADEAALTPLERGAALASVLRRTERRLERLHDRLLSLTSSTPPSPTSPSLLNITRHDGS